MKQGLTRTFLFSLTSAVALTVSACAAPGPIPSIEESVDIPGNFLQHGQASHVAPSFNIAAKPAAAKTVAVPVAAPVVAPAINVAQTLFSNPTLLASYDCAEMVNCQQTYGATPALWLTFRAGQAGINYDPTTLKRYLGYAATQKSVLTFVQYSIPGKGKNTAYTETAAELASYSAIVTANAQQVGMQAVNVIIEPDALPYANSTASVKAAVTAYKTWAPNAKLYIDAGHGGATGTGWVAAATMAKRLRSVGIAQADGFSLNVSNFHFTNNNHTYGNSVITALKASDGTLGGKKYVIDTSRNGNGPGLDKVGGVVTWGDPVVAQVGGAIQTGPGPNTGVITAYPSCGGYLWIKPTGVGDERIWPASIYSGLYNSVTNKVFDAARVKKNLNPRMI